MSWHSGLQFRVIEGPDPEEIQHLDKERMMIGRRRGPGHRAEGWFLLSDKAISRRHAEVIWNELPGRYTIYHRSTTNFTWVNDEPMTDQAPLNPGDLIRMGKTTFLLEPAQEIEKNVTVEGPGNEEITERLSRDLIQNISLRQGDPISMKVIEGADSGQTVVLEGFFLTIGRGNLQADALTNDKNAMKFDQMVELTDPSILPNHLVLKWDDIHSRFSIWKSPGAPPVTVRRQADRMNWVTQLDKDFGFVRAGDFLSFGKITLELFDHQKREQNSTVRGVPLEAPRAF